MMLDETRKVVESYFEAWTTNNVRAAYALLADDLEYTGPTSTYKRAEELWPELQSFAAMSKWARIVELIVAGQRAALLYDCELPQPVGILRIASFYHVEKGKIRTHGTAFDATLFRQFEGRKSETGQ